MRYFFCKPSQFQIEDARILEAGKKVATLVERFVDVKREFYLVNSCGLAFLNFLFCSTGLPLVSARWVVWTH